MKTAVMYDTKTGNTKRLAKVRSRAFIRESLMKRTLRQRQGLPGKQRGNVMKKRIAAGLLLLFLLALSLQVSAFAEALEQDQYESWMWEPYVGKDDSLSTGLVTCWSCITFGSYPQTEIVASSFTAVDDYAVQEGDVLEDPGLYKKLACAEWQDARTEIDGVRYLRVNRGDTAAGSTDSAQHYRWNENTEWRYFRFDPIRWRIIGLEGSAACLMADRLMDCRPYHTEDGPVTWESSAIRSWLNSYPAEENSAGIDYRGKGFLDTAFDAEQQKALIRTRVENRPNGLYGTDCGNDTEDCLFLLSNDEVFSSDTAARNGFFASTGYDDPAKRFRSTMYAKCMGSWWSSVNGYMGNSFWFMRTGGYTRESVTYICDFGYIYQRGTISTCEDAGVLPAVWIDLNLAKPEPAGTVSSRDILEGAFRQEAEEDPRQRDRIVNPVVRPDPEAPDGKEVSYSLIRFGSYPQSEIVPESDGASAGSIVNPELYGKLESIVWDGSECELEGRRYIRVTVPDKSGARYFVREPLVWRVLEVRDGTALLLSHAAVECEPFQEDLRDVSWENCTLRSWLNGYGAEANASGKDCSGAGKSFLDIAFSAGEREAILKTAVRNEANYYFGTDSGAQTEDRVFLPAESELFIHDSSEIHGFSRHDEVADRAKRFRPTGYALWKGAWQETGEQGNVFWITRTTGYTHANVVYVDESGYMYNRGILVTCRDAAVIPALVLDLDSDVYEYTGVYTAGGR